MASHQAVVEVLDGGTAVEYGVRRPVRLTPDGYAGVVYAGAVFPLHQENTINLSGPSWEKADCDRFLLVGESVPYAPGPETSGASVRPALVDEWNVESNRFGHYVVFNGSERVASAVVDALETTGLVVQRWDVSHRPANDGTFYDWFARLRSTGSRDDILPRIAAALAPAAPPTDARPTQALLAEPSEVLQAQVERLLVLTSDLQARLALAESDKAELAAELRSAAAAQSAGAAELDRARQHHRELQSQLERLSRSAEHEGAVQEALARQVEAEELLDLALTESTDLSRDVANLRAAVAESERDTKSLRATVGDLRERLQEVEHEERERRLLSSRTTSKRGALGFLHTAFSRLSFVLGGDEVLSSFASPAAALRQLVLIDMGERVGKDLEGLAGWSEVSKVATGIAGSEDMGRIYYCPNGDQVLVSVHLKRDDKEQRRHLERLRVILR